METDETMLGDKSSSIISLAIREGVMVKDMNLFQCQACKSNMTGIIPAECHLQGAKHKKAVQVFKRGTAMEQKCDNPNFSNSYVVAAIRSEQVLCDKLGNQVVLTCVPCNKSCSGEIPMMQHLLSEVHAKKMRQESLSSSLSASKERPNTLNASKTCYDSALPVNKQEIEAAIRSGRVSSTQLGNQVVLTCVPCNKQCSGEVPMMQHLASEVHAKKMRLGAQNSNFSSQKEVPSFIPSVATNQYNLASPANIHSVQENEVDQAVALGIIQAAQYDANHLQCLVCSVFCSGVDCMKEHLLGRNHLKMQKMSQLTLVGSPVSSPTHSKTLRYSPLSSKDDMAHRVITISPVLPSGLQELSVVCNVPVKKEGIYEYAKKEDVYECTVCKITFNSSAQKTNHLLGEPHKKQSGLKQTAVLMHQPVTAPESEARGSTSPPKDNGSTNIIPPPPQFKDSLRSRSPTTQKMNIECSNKQHSERLMKLLPDFRIYTSSDCLDDLFEE